MRRGLEQARCRHCGRLIARSDRFRVQKAMLRHMEAEHGHLEAREAIGERELEVFA